MNTKRDYRIFALSLMLFNIIALPNLLSWLPEQWSSSAYYPHTLYVYIHMAHSFLQYLVLPVGLALSIDTAAWTLLYFNEEKGALRRLLGLICILNIFGSLPWGYGFSAPPSDDQKLILNVFVLCVQWLPVVSIVALILVAKSYQLLARALLLLLPAVAYVAGLTLDSGLFKLEPSPLFHFVPFIRDLSRFAAICLLLEGLRTQKREATKMPLQPLYWAALVFSLMLFAWSRIIGSGGDLVFSRFVAFLVSCFLA